MVCAAQAPASNLHAARSGASVPSVCVRVMGGGASTSTPPSTSPSGTEASADDEPELLLLEHALAAPAETTTTAPKTKTLESKFMAARSASGFCGTTLVLTNWSG